MSGHEPPVFTALEFLRHLTAGDKFDSDAFGSVTVDADVGFHERCTVDLHVRKFVADEPDQELLLSEHELLHPEGAAVRAEADRISRENEAKNKATQLAASGGHWWRCPGCGLETKLARATCYRCNQERPCIDTEAMGVSGANPSCPDCFACSCGYGTGEGRKAVTRTP